MKKLFSIIIAAAIAACSFTACSSSGNSTVNDLDKIKEAGVLRVGMECNYAPFNWTQAEASDTTAEIASGGYADGYDIQIAKKLADALGVKLAVIKTEWDGLSQSLISGEIDAIIAGMSPTAERMLTIDFTDNYYKSDLVVVVQKDGAYADAKSINDFEGAKITGQLNTFHYTVIDQMNGVVKQTALSDFSAMIVALQSGAIDGYISERPGAVSAVTANPNLAFVEFEGDNGFVTSDDDTAIAVGIRKGSDLKDTLNEALAKITNDERETLMNDAVARQPLSEDE